MTIKGYKVSFCGDETVLKLINNFVYILKPIELCTLFFFNIYLFLAALVFLF